MSASSGFDFDAFLALPRLGGLTVSPDGRRLAVNVGRLATCGTAFESSVWEVDLAGADELRRLTRWFRGARAPRFAPDGSLLFLAPGDGEAERTSRLLRLPAGPGEAEVVAAPPAGVAGVGVARDHGRVVVAALLHAGTTAWDEDAARERDRSERKLTAQLHEGYPMRHWDRWLGPRERQLFAQGDGGAFHHLTSGAGTALEDEAFDVAPDGGAVATTWAGAPHDPRDDYTMLVVVEIGLDGSAGARRILIDEPRVAYEQPAWSPEGDRLAAIRKTVGTPERCEDRTLVIVDAASGGYEDVLAGFDRWPASPVWAPDGRAVYFTADDDGHCPPFRVDLDTGEVTRLAAEGAWTDLAVCPNGDVLYALRSLVAEPPHLVAVDTGASDAEPRRLPAPAAAAEEAAEPRFRRHRVERVAAAASDGERVPGWLVLPAAGDGPAPLVTLVHGGPLGSWNTWHWRWNPHLLAARGWAVLLPDPALSTGYGLAYVQRGWGRWGGEPYTDVMALIDAVCARDDVDGDRTAVMGGSFGGYLVNWIAGHTDRFDAIVSHASVWNLESFHGVTDLGPRWENEFGDRYEDAERLRRWSPHRFVDRVTTPILIIHGQNDYRVPISEAVAMWTDLRRHGATAAFLHFPDENHWVLAPQHSRVWYEAVFAWLDHHVLGKPWRRPRLL